MNFPDEYYWLSNREVLVLRQISKAFDKPALVRRDIITGNETRFTKLGHLYRATNGAPTIPVGLSPDRKWFMWYDYINTDFVARLDGGGFFSVGKKKDAQQLWGPNSRFIATTWIEMYYPEWTKSYLDTWPVTPPHTRRRITFDLSKIPRSKDLSPLRFTSGNEILLTEGCDAIPRSAIPLLSIRIRHGRATIGSLKQLRCPRRAAPTELELAPNGRRVAWLVHYSVRSRPYSAIWMHNVGGDRIRAIGTILERSEKLEAQTQALRWLPDSRQISFYSNGKHWIFDTSSTRYHSAARRRSGNLCFHSAALKKPRQA